MSQRLGIVFPGQGSQKPGMLGELAQDYRQIADTFTDASVVLGYDLWDLVQTDDGSQLSRTSVTQPAILTASVAIWRIWQDQNGLQPSLLAGHSLGEYAALVAAQVLTFEAAVALVQKRGEFMQSAVPEGVGTMAAIVGLDDETVIKVCRDAEQNDVVSAVNFNSPGQVVIAGHQAAVERAMAACKTAGAKRALPLPVSAPFHCKLMQPAAERFAEVLSAVELRPPQIPVLQNFSLTCPDDIASIRANLISQIFSPVPWVDTVRYFAEDGIARMLELGPGKVLTGLNKRIQPEIDCLSVNDPDSLNQALSW